MKKKIERPCPICKGRLVETEAQDLLSCPGCLFFQKKELPEKNEYLKRMAGFAIASLRTPQKAAKKKNQVKAELDWILENSPGPGRLFDVGAGGGFLMNEAKEKGWLVKGNEVSNKSIAWAEKNFGLEMIYGLLEDLEVEQEVYDLVVFWHTLEHSLDLELSLKKSWEMLRPGGILAIAVPRRQNLDEASRFYERFHHFEFSTKALCNLVASRGWQLVVLREVTGQDQLNQIQVIYKKPAKMD